MSSTGAGIGKPARGSTSMSNLAFWKTFSTAGSVSSGPSTAIAAASLSCSAETSCAQRHVAGAARRGGQREADQARAHRVQPVGLGVQRDPPAVTRLGDPGAQRIGGGHGFDTARSRAPSGAGTAPGRAASAGSELPLQPTGRRRLRLRPAAALDRPVEPEPGDDAAETLRRQPGRQRPLWSQSRWPAPRPAAAAAHPRAAHQLARDARLLGMLDQHVAPLGGLHRRRRRQHRLEVAEFVDQLRGALRADAGHAGHVVDGVADQRLHLDHLVGRDAEFLHHLGRADRLLLDRVQHLDARPDQLHQVLVGGHDGHLAAGRRPRSRHRRRSGRRPPSRPARSPARRTPRSPRAPGRIAGSAPRAAAGGAPCRRRRGGCGRSRGRRRRSRRYGCRHGPSAAWPACW